MRHLQGASESLEDALLRQATGTLETEAPAPSHRIYIFFKILYEKIKTLVLHANSAAKSCGKNIKSSLTSGATITYFFGYYELEIRQGLSLF